MKKGFKFTEVGCGLNGAAPFSEERSLRWGDALALEVESGQLWPNGYKPAASHLSRT